MGQYNSQYGTRQYRANTDMFAGILKLLPPTFLKSHPAPKMGKIRDGSMSKNDL